MHKKTIIVFLIILLIFQIGCGIDNQKNVIPPENSKNSQNEVVIRAESGNNSQNGVIIADKGNYYKVVLDFSKGLGHKQIGEEYAKQIKKAVPEFESLVDTYIYDLTANKNRYKYILVRVNDIKHQIPQEYKDEIEGMATVFSGGTINIRGDKKLSIDELYFFNLIPDVVRPSQCLAVSVFGQRSATHKAMVARILDWFGGYSNEIPKIQSVTTIKYNDKMIYSVGYLGYMGIVTGFNNKRVFAAILDSPTGRIYSSVGKRSYPMDLRFALENKSDLNGVAGYMKDPSRDYAFNHLIFLSDSDEGKVLENNFSGKGKNMQRALRSSDSQLNKGIIWGISDSIATVNSFLLNGNHDNHTREKINTRRWENIKTQLLAKGSEVTFDELKEVVSFHKRSKPGSMSNGDLYNTGTQQIVLFEPDTFNLEVFFKPKSSVILPGVPVFEKIQIP